MATIKAYTSIEQSKKLAEFLPLESADMHYSRDFDGSWFVDLAKYTSVKLPKYMSNVEEHLLPCWSLASLLGVLPLGIYDEFDNYDYELEINMIDKMPRYIRLGDIYHSQFPYDFEKDTLLDNIVESIIWLNDNNYFEL